MTIGEYFGCNSLKNCIGIKNEEIELKRTIKMNTPRCYPGFYHHIAYKLIEPGHPVVPVQYHHPIHASC
jgi:hypothetical protein